MATQFEIPEDLTASMDLQMIADVVQALGKRKFIPPAKDYFDADGPITILFDQASVVVYAIDENDQMVTLDGDRLELVYRTSWEGYQGTLDEHLDAIDDYDKDGQEEILATFEDYMSADDRERIQNLINSH